MPSLISLTFDDGFRCQFDKALPILDANEIPATFFLIANEKPTHESRINEWWKIEWRDEDIEMLKAAIKKGHEIGSHSVTHDKNKMPQQPDVETRESKKLIEDWIGCEVSSFCYPYYGSCSYLSNAARSAGYRQARTGHQSTHYPLSTPPGFDIDCREVAANDNVDDWVRPNHWHVLTFHGIGDGKSGWANIPVSRFTVMVGELATRRDSSELEILTFGEAALRLHGGDDSVAASS